jgi:hypothetical protein
MVDALMQLYYAAGLALFCCVGLVIMVTIKILMEIIYFWIHDKIEEMKK